MHAAEREVSPEVPIINWRQPSAELQVHFEEVSWSAAAWILMYRAKFMGTTRVLYVQYVQHFQERRCGQGKRKKGQI
jgi:hypothetical protein